MTRQDYINGLRGLADFLEQHPGVPQPSAETIYVFAKSREDIAAIARLASWEKAFSNEWFMLRKHFGGVILEVNIARNEVCRKVVTGTRTLPAEPARPAQPEREVEEYTWVCDEPLLAVQS